MSNCKTRYCQETRKRRRRKNFKTYLKIFLSSTGVLQLQQRSQQRPQQRQITPLQTPLTPNATANVFIATALPLTTLLLRPATTTPIVTNIFTLEELDLNQTFDRTRPWQTGVHYYKLTLNRTNFDDGIYTIFGRIYYPHNSYAARSIEYYTNETFTNKIGTNIVSNNIC